MSLELDKAALSFFALGIVSTIGEIMLDRRKAHRDALRQKSIDTRTDVRARSSEVPNASWLDDAE